MKRRFPADIQTKMSTAELELSAIRDFFSSNWLSKDLQTPVHRLWKDPSIVAGLELYIYDQCLRAIPNVSKTWLEDKRETIINHPDSRHIAGSLTEFIFAGMFSLGGHKVNLAPKSMPVYDFTVESSGKKTPYVSCKYVGAKDSELRFLSDMKKFEGDIKSILSPERPVHILVQVYERNLTAKFSELVQPLKQIYNQYRSSPPDHFGVLGKKDRFFLGLGQLSPLDDGVVFSKHRPSYTLIAAHEIHPNEQLKFNDTVIKADSDFGTLSAEDRDDRLHLLTVLINPSLDFSRACQWVDNEFQEGRLKNLECVMIARIQPTQEIHPDGSFNNVITTEYQFIVNKQISSETLKDAFGGSGISLQVPVGKTSQSTTNIELKVRDQTINLNGHYVHYSGEHYYGKEGLGEVKMTTYPNIQIHTDWDLLDGRITLAPKDQNRTNFVLI